MKDRLARLAALTRGAAMITISAGTAGAVGGCTKNEPPPPPPVAAGTIQPDPAADPPDAAPTFPRRKFPMPNAIHPGFGWNSPRDGGPVDGGPDNAP
jgi:hypothetical protein